MDIFKRLFSKTRNAGVFSFVFPQAPAGLQNREFLKAYRGWVYACVRAIANDVGTMELQLQKKSGGDWAEVKSHEAIDLLGHVNPFISSDGLFKGTSSYLDLTGNAFWYVAYNGKNKPAELWLLDPTKMEVLKDDREFIKGWVYTNPKGIQVKLRPEEVIPFQEFNPEDPFRGKGPVEAAALAIDTNRYAGEWNRNFFFNSAMPSMALMTDQKLNDESYERLMAKWESKFRGVQNAHKPAVLEGGLKVQVINPTAKEMDFTAQGHQLRDEILAMFGVPKSVLGIVEDVNRANAEASEYVFAKRVIMPRERFIATTLSEFYLPLWGLSSSEYRLFPKDVTPQNVEADLKRKEAGLKAGWYTINEVREQEALPKIEGGDEVYLPQNLIPLDAETRGQLPAMEPGSANEKPDPQKSAKAIAKSAELDKRARYLSRTINQAQKQVEAFYKQQAQSVQDSLKPLKSAKEIEETNTTDPLAVVIDETELVKRALGEWEQWIPGLIALVAAIDERVYSYAGQRTLTNALIDIAFDQHHERAEQWLRDRALRSATQINETIKEEIRSRLVAGVEAGKGAKEIAEDIGEFFDQQSQWRALRIARTEVMEAYAQGSLEAARQHNLEEKRWIATHDARVDETCLMNEADGWIPREQAFSSGHLAPVIHPNDRCDLEFRRVV